MCTSPAATSGKPSAKATRKVADARADAAYDVAKEKCDDLKGNDKDVCEKDAKAARVKAKEDAKVAEAQAKPADSAAILRALDEDALDADMAVADSVEFHTMSVSRLEWEHIQRVLNEHDGNVSATARALSMHRRTLQRKLAKKPVGR